ncbi:MAG: Ig-like domain-containing protein [bacterium]
MRRINNQNGFSFVELLIILALSTFVITCMTNYFIHLNNSYKSHAQISDAQQNGRVATEYLTRSIQCAGYKVIRGGKFLAASDRYLALVYDDNDDGVIQNTEVITYCLSKQNESATETLTIDAYFDRDEDGEVEADEEGTFSIPLSLSGPSYIFYKAVPNLNDEECSTTEIATGVENLIFYYYDQDDQPLPETYADPNDPNSPRIAPALPYDFSSVPQQLTNIRRIEVKLKVVSDDEISGKSSQGTYTDYSVGTYDEYGTPRTDISYEDSYYHYSYQVNVTPRNLIENPYGRLVLHAYPSSVHCTESSSSIIATLINNCGDSLVGQTMTFCVNYDDEDGSADASIEPNVIVTDEAGQACAILTYDWSNGPKTFTVSASSVVDIDPGEETEYKTLYNAIGVLFLGLSISPDPTHPPPYVSGDTATFQATGGLDPYAWDISLAPANPENWVQSTSVGYIDANSGTYHATAIGTILVRARDASSCSESIILCPEISISHSPDINFTPGDTTTFSAAHGTPPYSWLTANTTIGVIDQDTGVFTQLGTGYTHVTVIDYNGCRGQVQTCTQISITPQDPNCVPGGFIFFSTSNGQSPYTWYTSDESVGTIGFNTGLFEAVDYGHATVTVIDADGCQGQTTVTTCPVISIDPESPRYDASEEDTFGAVGGTTPYSWESSEPSIGSINDSGYFLASARGRTTITVTDSNGCQKQTVVTVCEELDIDPNIFDCSVGDMAIFSVSEGEEPYTWSSSDPNIAIIGTGGEMEALSSGLVTITATDSFGCEGHMVISITESPILFEDDFFNFNSWVTICGTWNVDSGVLRAQNISNNAVIALKDSVWDNDWVDYEVIVKLKQNTSDDMDGALLARYQSDTQNYKLEMDTDSDGLHLDKWNGGEIQLGSSYAFSYSVDTWYYQKIRVEGNQISAKAWAEGEPEPISWLITRTDSTFSSGKIGLRVFSADVSFERIAVYSISE